ncbi:fluoride efflux transporter FluC [Levilactobacillus acidifarinae]|uniref:Fluoride-specific ion channel FluC n=1 Tax=Levilactobacillus acidifarinae DSM 19394 = JCM 15949 TaxID=1423715 RepID=A0A0R1LHJ5_9LACO|nr:CrcB family protein [Levilactobacillus acidifarinae]KRK95371.1 hypothetical protein FD25_GL001489 [Levilactobacillus acidifarinae DSM 19394]GEO70037.1 putative fluoride ion transporter CrcB 2 [Levilactobacillus acidifarinae]
MFKKILAILLFGFCGSFLRTELTLVGQHYLVILTINVLGSFLLAFIAQTLPALISLSEATMTGLSVGLVGSFTTFSTFTMDVVTLFTQGAFGLAFAYLAGSLILSSGAVILGFRTSLWVTAGVPSK